MIRINLLPHRELRRERRKKEFMVLLVLTVVAGAVLALMVALAIDNRIDAQLARNKFIQGENAKLDEQIKEIAQLRQEIESLKARQLAVESLQRDRTLPVHVMDDLVKHTPDGMHFKQLKQTDRKVMLTGLSESNERVSNLLRALAHDTPWLERPELVEIKAVTLGKPEKDKEPRRVFEFAVNATIKALTADGDKVAAAGQTVARAPAVTAAPSAAASPAPAGAAKPTAAAR